MTESSLELVDVAARSATLGPGVIGTCSQQAYVNLMALAPLRVYPMLSASHRKTERRENNASD